MLIVSVEIMFMCEYSVRDYLQLSQVGKVVKGVSTNSGQFVVAKISGK